MSADNFIGIFESEGRWYTTNGSMSLLLEDDSHRGIVTGEYPSYHEAIAAAEKDYFSTAIVEYAIVKLDN